MALGRARWSEPPHIHAYIGSNSPRCSASGNLARDMHRRPIEYPDSELIPNHAGTFRRGTLVRVTDNTRAQLFTSSGTWLSPWLRVRTGGRRLVRPAQNPEQREGFMLRSTFGLG